MALELFFELVVVFFKIAPLCFSLFLSCVLKTKTFLKKKDFSCFVLDQADLFYSESDSSQSFAEC